MDFIPLLPLTLLFRGKQHKFKVFYLLKVIRLIMGLKVFSINKIMKAIEFTKLKRSQQNIKDNRAIGEDILNDHNNIHM